MVPSAGPWIRLASADPSTSSGGSAVLDESHQCGRVSSEARSGAPAMSRYRDLSRSRSLESGRQMIGSESTAAREEQQCRGFWTALPGVLDRTAGGGTAGGGGPHCRSWGTALLLWGTSTAGREKQHCREAVPPQSPALRVAGLGCGVPPGLGGPPLPIYPSTISAYI